MALVGELRFLSGPRKGQTVRCTGPTVTIGRSKQADVVVDDPFASRLHVRIVRSGEGYVVENASSNPTKLNGKRVDRAELTDGDTLQVGRKCRLKFRLVEQVGAVISHVSGGMERTGGGALDGNDEYVEAPEGPQTAAAGRERPFYRNPKVIAALAVYFVLLAAVAVWLFYAPEAASPPTATPMRSEQEVLEKLVPELTRSENPIKARETLLQAQTLASTASQEPRNLWAAFYRYKEAEAYGEVLSTRDKLTCDQLQRDLAKRIWSLYINALAHMQTRRYRDAVRVFNRILRLLDYPPPEPSDAVIERSEVYDNVRAHLHRLVYLMRRR